MKALELTVHPTYWLSGRLWCDTAPAATFVGPIDVDYWVACKRLTDAELAAEVWCGVEERTRHAGNILGGQHDNPYAQKAFNTAIERAITLHRFATLPHYDEPLPQEGRLWWSAGLSAAERGGE